MENLEAFCSCLGSVGCSTSVLPLYQLFLVLSLATLLFLEFHPADRCSGFHLGLFKSLLSDNSLSYPFRPPMIAFLVCSRVYSLLISFWAYLSMISSLLSMFIISEVFTILLIISWLRVALLVPSGMALLLCRTMFGTIVFSKYW